MCTSNSLALAYALIQGSPTTGCNLFKRMFFNQLRKQPTFIGLGQRRLTMPSDIICRMPFEFCEDQVPGHGTLMTKVQGSPAARQLSVLSSCRGAEILHFAEAVAAADLSQP